VITSGFVITAVPQMIEPHLKTSVIKKYP